MFFHPTLPRQTFKYTFHLVCVLSICALLPLFSACDNSGVSTRESPQYVVRPSQEVIFPILVVGREITKELEIENVGGVDLIIARSIICLLYTSPSPRD